MPERELNFWNILLMIKVAIVGASGYAGGELVRLLSRHQDVQITHLYVSEHSTDAHVEISELYGSVWGQCHLPLEPLSLAEASGVTSEDCDVIFLATDHKVSHDLAPIFLDNDIIVIDLSGAFRIAQLDLFAKYYGFSLGSVQTELMAERVYGLVDWVKREEIQGARLLAMPGCYPTASELALKPLTAHGLLDLSMPPVINAVSGVSGAGRKAKLGNSFCEVSLNAYGLFTHRHRVEIEENVGSQVIFNPHLGDFKRGILATITARLQPNVSTEQITAAYQQAYPQSLVADKSNANLPWEEQSLVRFKPEHTIKLHDVQELPYCDISFKRDGDYIVISSAIDNLLKGAASQAIEAMNIHFGLPRARSLV